MRSICWGSIRMRSKKNELSHHNNFGACRRGAAPSVI